MKKSIFCILIFLFSLSSSFAQTPTPTPKPSPRAVVKTENVFDLTEYGVRVEPEPRLIIVMATLEAAGFDSKIETPFRTRLRADLSGLDANLRRKLNDFYVRNKVYTVNANGEKIEATPSEQVSRYVSLAYALSPAPELAAPARSAELPGGLLEVLDFAALVKEFYEKSGIDEKLPQYTRGFQGVGDTLRPQIANAVRDVTAYLNTRPQTSYLQRQTVTAKNAKNNKKAALQTVEVREFERKFIVVPDLFAAPNSVKLRVIGDNYFVVVGAEVEPAKSSEFRRAYLQFLVDPLIYKNAKEIAVQKDVIRSIIDDRTKTGAEISPDVFLATARSLVVAADVMQTKSRAIQLATDAARVRINREKTEATKKAVFDALEAEKKIIETDALAQLAEGFNDGAVLVFYFADALRGLESAGFDISGSFTDMVATFDGGKEKLRLKANESARNAAIVDSQKRRQTAFNAASNDDEAARIRNSDLIANLNNVEKLLTAQDYEAAEAKLKTLLGTYPGEPRILFALGRTASLSARNVFDEQLRDQRLAKAVSNFRFTLESGNAELPLQSVARVALAKIYEFYADENPEYKIAALKEYETAVSLGNVPGGAYSEAVAGKQRLSGK